MGEHAHINTINVSKLIRLLFLTLLIATALNSSSLYVIASAWEESPNKTIALKILKPISNLTSFFGIDSLRTSSREAIGFNRDDKIDNFQFKISNEELVVTPSVTTIPKLTPDNKLTSWIIGDSLAATPGESLLSKLPISSFDVFGLDSRVSTGLARPDVFNWFSYIQEFVQKNKPQTIIISIGANDDQSLYSENGSVGPFPNDAWVKEYSRRVNSTLDFLYSQKVYTLWVEIPPVRDPVRDARYQLINQITKDAISKHPNSSSLVETKTAFTDPNGNYNDSLYVNGQETLLRSPDGIHFTRAGGNLIADLVISKLHTLYDF